MVSRQREASAADNADVGSGSGAGAHAVPLPKAADARRGGARTSGAETQREPERDFSLDTKIVSPTLLTKDVQARA